MHCHVSLVPKLNSSLIGIDSMTQQHFNLSIFIYINHNNKIQIGKERQQKSGFYSGRTTKRGGLNPLTTKKKKNTKYKKGKKLRFIIEFEPIRSRGGGGRTFCVPSL